MRRAYRQGRNWKRYSFFVVCNLCSKSQTIEFSYFTNDQTARIMYAAKAGWQYDEGRWLCPEHRLNDVAP
jgi:hypothetical protein